MATKKPKLRQRRRLSGPAFFAYAGLGIGALATGIFVLVTLFHKPSAPVATAVTTHAPQANRAHAEIQTPEAPLNSMAHAAKDDSQQASNAIKPASVRMSPEQWQALDELLVRQFKRCWTDKPHKAPKQYIPKIEVVFEPNGSLQTKPNLINASDDPTSKALAASAIKAIMRCNPLNIPSTFGPFYDEWKKRVVYFDPSIFESADASR
jgi:hypothetical protein